MDGSKATTRSTELFRQKSHHDPDLSALLPAPEGIAPLSDEGRAFGRPRAVPWRRGGAALYCRHVRACHLQTDQISVPLMIDNPVWEICERVAEVQALLDDHAAADTEGYSTAAELGWPG
jgi:hypothetical protein